MILIVLNVNGGLYQHQAELRRDALMPTGMQNYKGGTLHKQVPTDCGFDLNQVCVEQCKKGFESWLRHFLGDPGLNTSSALSAKQHLFCPLTMTL